MTSNIGSSLIRENYANITAENHEDVEEKTKQQVLEMLKTTIRPEFLNRIDEIVMFKPLNKSQIEDIVRIQLNGIIKMLKSNGVTLSFSDEAIEMISTLGYDPEFGARPVKRVIQRQVLDTLSKKILADSINKSAPIEVVVKDGVLDFSN